MSKVWKNGNQNAPCRFAIRRFEFGAIDLTLPLPFPSGGAVLKANPSLNSSY
jgi:hypothetical protein